MRCVVQSCGGNLFDTGREAAVMKFLIGRMVQGVFKRRILIALLCVSFLVLLTIPALELKNGLRGEAEVATGDAAAVSRLLSEQFGSPYAQSAVLAITGLPDLASDEGASALRRIVSAIRSVPGATAVRSYLDNHDSYLVGTRPGSAMVIVGLGTEERTASASTEKLQAITPALIMAMSVQAPALRMHWVSAPLIDREFRAFSSHEASRGEKIALPLTLAVLVAVFGSVTAALFPLVLGAWAIPVALGAAMLVAALWPMSAIVVNVITMIGLALSIDYSLLVMDGFHELMAKGCTRHQAAMESARNAGQTVCVSGSAVAVGFASLLVVPVSEIRSVAIGGLLATVTAVFLAMTLLPIALSFIGPRPSRRKLKRYDAEKFTLSVWVRWGRFVVAHPTAVLLAAAIPLLILSAQAERIKLELPSGNWLPPQAESTAAIEDLRRIDRGTLSDEITLVLQAPPGQSVASADGWARLQHLSRTLADDPKVDHVMSAASLPGAERLGPAILDRLPPSEKRALVSEDGRSALAQIVPAHQIQFNEVSQFVRELRGKIASAARIAPYQVKIGGRAAAEADYEDAVSGSVLLVVSLVVAGTFAVLALSFQSLLVPVKAVALNLLSVTAGLGAVVLVFQDGYGANVFGLIGPTGSVFPAIPVLVFCAAFGVSMDYEVFLVSCVVALRRTQVSDAEAVSRALGQTGSLITGAAAVMIAVFGAFMFGNLLVIKMLGFALAATVLIDVTVVRLAICPALLILAGRWNWWPGDAVAMPRPEKTYGRVGEGVPPASQFEG
jgi:putative drug exporter of the RND superfamily